jgi:hypothetical protein
MDVTNLTFQGRSHMSIRSNETGYQFSAFALVMCYSIHGLGNLLRYTAGPLHVDFGPIARQQHFTDALDGVPPDPIRVPTCGRSPQV